MREIKFRAWNNKHNKWILDPAYTEPMIDFEGDLYRVATECCENPRMELENHTLMQYIGHKDGNGKEIYEGDLLQVANNIIYEIIFMTEDDCEEKVSAFGIRRSDKTCFPIDHYAIKNGIVIGNIHESPELLTSHT